MTVNKRTATFSIIWALLTVAAICLAPTNIFSDYGSNKYYAGIIYCLLVSNLFETGYGSVSFHVPSGVPGYFLTLSLFILPIIFIFIVRKARIQTIRIFSLFMLFPPILLYLVGAINGKPDFWIIAVYFIMTFVQVFLWFTAKIPDANIQYYNFNDKGQQPGPYVNMPSSSGPVPPLANPVETDQIDAKPSNWLWLGILTTILCCLPLGIVSIVFGSKVDSCWAREDYMSAVKYSDKAKKWALAAIVTAFVFFVIYFLIVSIAINRLSY